MKTVSPYPPIPTQKNILLFFFGTSGKKNSTTIDSVAGAQASHNSVPQPGHAPPGTNRGAGEGEEPRTSWRAGHICHVTDIATRRSRRRRRCSSSGAGVPAEATLEVPKLLPFPLPLPGLLWVVYLVS